MTYSQVENQLNQYMFRDGPATIRPRYVRVKKPPRGSKIACITEPGLWVFEEVDCQLMGISVTHAGSGGMTGYDGVPNADGYFPMPPKPIIQIDLNKGILKAGQYRVPVPHDYKGELGPVDHNGYAVKELTEEEAQHEQLSYEVNFWNRNGREIFFAHPACLGMFVFSAGLEHGLTILTSGGNQASPPFFSVMWLPNRELK